MKARIYKSTGTWYNAKGEDNRFYLCRIKGKLKLDREITSTNPIAVGDIVILEPEVGADQQAMIVSIEKRNNYLIRSSPHNKRQKHIVAANLDQSILVATIKDPRTSTGFIDRFLVSSEAYHIPAVIVINKADTYDEQDLQYFEFLKAIYTACGYPVYLIAAEKQQGLDVFNTILKNKVSLLSGHSGVGKSTLLNQLLPHVEAATQEVSEWSGKGMHTTTFAEMYDLPQGGMLIDTPGIRELGITQMQRAELSGYFPEMKALAGFCKYNNCSHFNEPQCAVKEAVRNGQISEERYVNYANIYDSMNDKHYE